MKFYKIIFFSSMTIGTLISISSLTWMGMWMGLEINLLSIIPLMNSNKNLFSSEASLKYFITQALASTILLLSIILSASNFLFIYELKSNMIMILNSALLTKMGAAPFHFWFPKIMEGLSWMNCLIMLCWQKIAPMVILSYNMNFPWFFIFVILVSMLISGVFGFNQISLRKILAYSSINHIAWMISSLMIFESIWFTYFLVYTLITINIILIFNILNIFYLKQMFTMMNQIPMIKLFFALNFLSLGGLPPFIGFLPKWITIENLIKNDLLILAFFMVILTLMTLFFYIRLIYSTLTLKMNNPAYSQQPNINKNWIILSNFLSLVSLLISTMIFNFL